MHCSHQVWACIAPDSHATAIRQTFLLKIAKFDQNLPFSSSPDPIFVRRLPYTYVMPRFEIKTRRLTQLWRVTQDIPGTSCKLLVNKYPVNNGRTHVNECPVNNGLKMLGYLFAFIIIVRFGWVIVKSLAGCRNGLDMIQDHDQIFIHKLTYRKYFW